MDPVGATDESGAGLMERDGDGCSSAFDDMGTTADWRHSLDGVCDSDHVSGVAISYWQSSIAQV